MSAAGSAEACFTGKTGDREDRTRLPAEDEDRSAEPLLPDSAGTAAASGLRVEADDGPLLGDADDVRANTKAESRRLFGQLAELDPEDRERARARDRLTELHLPLAEHLARKFAGRGEPYEDLVQVATIGLIKAIDRYDLGRGVEFSTFAMPTIMGEIKRWFRDKGWAIRVPRRLQELRMIVSSVTTDLLQQLGRSPTVAELADAAGITEEDVLEALETATAYSTLSLDSPEYGENTQSAIETLGQDDEALEGVENRETLNRMLSSLPERERTIIVLRFFRGMTQSQIAREIGISQMHVSRLLSRTLARLREGIFT